MAEGDTSVPIMRYDSRNDDMSTQDIDKNPLVVSKTQTQRDALINVHLGASSVQEIENRTGLTEKFKAVDPSNKPFTEIMERVTGEALDSGADPYAVMSAIHTGTVEGNERSQHLPEVNKAKDWISYIKSIFTKSGSK